MSDLLTTLHPINDENTDLYPNVKRDNLPQSVKDELDAIPNKVDKVQGKGLSTNDFTNADKALVDTIPDKVDKVAGKGLSTNDFTNADKSLVDTIPDKVDKVNGKGLSTNDYTNADKNAVEVAFPLRLSFLNTNILDLYRLVIRSGGMITVTDASVALTSQTFPLTASPKALLNYVGGMCQKVGDSIITAPVTTVISKGFNLWDEEWDNSIIIPETGEKAVESPIQRISSKNYISVYPSTTYYIKITGSTMRVYFYGNNHEYLGNSGNTQIGNATFNTPSNCRYIMFSTSAGYGTTYNHDICINVSNATMNGTYKPYSAPVYYPIHRDIRALDGYGYGLNADCCNYIDFADKKYVKECMLYTFSQNDQWSALSGDRYICGSLNDIVKIPLDSVKADALVTGMTVVSKNNLTNANASIAIADGGIYIYDPSNITSADMAKSYMNGKSIVFQLATPVETDISDLLVLSFPTYDIINVIAGGYLEFENENNIGVPYSVTYQYKPDAQTTVQSIASTAISEVDSNDPTDSI